MKKLLVIGGSIIAILLLWIVGIGNLKNNGESKDRAKHYMDIGNEQLDLGAYGTAIKAYDMVLSLDPTIDNFLYMGDIYYRIGKIEKYKSLLSALIKKYPLEPIGYEKYAEYYSEIDDKENCLQVARQALNNDIKTEKLLELYYNSAYTYWFVGGEYEEASPFFQGYAAVKFSNKMRLVNDNVKINESIVYDFVSYYTGEMVAIQNEDGSAYFVDMRGEKYLDSPKSYQKVWAYNEGVAVAVHNNKYTYINNVFKELSEEYDYATSFIDGMAAVKKGNQWSIINSAREEIGSGVYSDILVDEYNFCSKFGVVFAKVDDFYYLINKNGKKVGEHKFEDAKPFFEDSITAVKLNGKWGFINKEGVLIIEPEYEDAQPFGNGLGAVKIDGKWGFVNKSNRLLIENEFEDVKCFSKNKKAPVKVEGLWRYIQILG